MTIYIVLSLFITYCVAGGGGLNGGKPKCECTECIMDKCNAYLSAEEPYKAEEDAERIHDAYLLGVYLEETLTSILFYRTAKQREDIVKAYKDLTKLELTLQLQYSAHIKFADLFVALLKPIDIFLSDEVHKALRNKQGGFDGGSRLPEVLVNVPACLGGKVSDSYKYEHSIYSLHYVLGAAFHGTTMTTLQDLAAGYRTLCDAPDIEAAKADAEALTKGGVGRFINKKKKFREIFTQRSYPQLREILKEYHSMRTEKDSNYKTIGDDLQETFSGTTLRIFTLMAQIYTDQPRTLAFWLKTAIESKMYEQIVFIVRITYDNNLADLKAAYDKGFVEKLEDKIKNSSIRRAVKDQLIAVFQFENLDEYPLM